jgi:transcriptional regulator with XRE-family HTH domain
MSDLRTVAELCQQRSLDARQLAERAGLDERRVLAIVQGQWTPSPGERDRIAAVFGLTRDRIAWGHTTPVEHLYGHGPQFGRTP